MLGEIVDDLKKNPMLALFQAGNELVHSNLLAWILEYNNDQLISKKLKACLSIPQEHRIEKVFREKDDFDILIVHSPAEQVENSGNSDNVGFVVIENKFKSLPTIGQLEKYTKKINSNTLKPYEKTKLNSQNTKKVLFAPQIFLDTFSKETEWALWSYEDYLEIIKIYIQNQGQEAVVISKYVEMTQTILDIGNRYIKADREKNLCSPNKDNINELAEIRLDSPKFEF